MRQDLRRGNNKAGHSAGLGGGGKLWELLPAHTEHD